MSRLTLGLILGFLGVVAFGGTFPMTRLAVQHFEPWMVTFWRPGLAGLLALSVLVALRRPLPPREIWPTLALASFGIVWGFPGLVNFAMRLVESSHAGVIAGILPMATAIAASLILRDRQPPAFWAVAALGMVTVVGFAMRESGGSLSAGDLIMLLAVAVASTAYVLSAKATRVLPGWEVISWILVLGLPINLIGMFLTWPPATGPGSFADAPLWPWLGLIYVTVISQYVGFFPWNAGLAMGGAARVGQVQLLQTFVTLVFAATLVGEQVEPGVWAVAALVVLLVFAAQRLARKT